jgi:hypothetical protein
VRVRNLEALDGTPIIDVKPNAQWRRRPTLGGGVVPSRYSTNCRARFEVPIRGRYIRALVHLLHVDPDGAAAGEADLIDGHRLRTKSYRPQAPPSWWIQPDKGFEHGHTEQNCDMSLRTASSAMRRRACSRVDLTLSGLPEARRQRLCCPGTLAGGAGRGRRRGKDVGAHRGQRPSGDLPLLPALRFDHSLCDRRMARRGRHTSRRLCGPDIPGAKIFSLRTSEACLDRSARR